MYLKYFMIFNFYNIVLLLLFQNYCEAMERGISKVMAKMGISTLQSYKGAQIFEAVGLADEVINKCFKGTQSRIGGINFERLAKEAYERHYLSYSNRNTDMLVLMNPGYFHWRTGGEKHINDPISIANLQVSLQQCLVFIIMLFFLNLI